MYSAIQSYLIVYACLCSVPLERLLKRSSPLYNVIYPYNTITSTSPSTTPTTDTTNTNTTSTDFTTPDLTAITSATSHSSHGTSDKVSVPSSSSVVVVDEVEKEGVSDITHTTSSTPPHTHNTLNNNKQSSTEGHNSDPSSSYIHTSFPSNECLLYISDTAYLAVGPDNSPNNATVVSAGFFLLTTHRLLFFPTHYAAALDNTSDRATNSSTIGGSSSSVRGSSYLSTHYPRTFPLSLSLNELSTASLYYCACVYVYIY